MFKWHSKKPVAACWPFKLFIKKSDDEFKKCFEANGRNRINDDCRNCYYIGRCQRLERNGRYE